MKTRFHYSKPPWRFWLEQPPAVKSYPLTWPVNVSRRRLRDLLIYQASSFWSSWRSQSSHTRCSREEWLGGLASPLDPATPLLTSLVECASSYTPTETRRNWIVFPGELISFNIGLQTVTNPIHRAVCESPEVGSDYLAAAKLWYKMHKIISAVPYSEKYTKVVQALNTANSLGQKGGDCSRFSW